MLEVLYQKNLAEIEIYAANLNHDVMRTTELWK